MFHMCHPRRTPNASYRKPTAHRTARRYAIALSLVSPILGQRHRPTKGLLLSVGAPHWWGARRMHCEAPLLFPPRAQLAVRNLRGVRESSALRSASCICIDRIAVTMALTLCTVLMHRIRNTDHSLYEGQFHADPLLAIFRCFLPSTWPRCSTQSPIGPSRRSWPP